MGKNRLRVSGALAALAVAVMVSVRGASAASPDYQIKQLGLMGNGYEYMSGGGMWRTSTFWQLNRAGQVVGTSSRYNSFGTNGGEDAWFYDGLTSEAIGLAGSGYEFSFTGGGGGTYHQSAVVGLNDIGEAVGTTLRFSSPGASYGQDSWLHDATGTHTIGLTGVGYSHADAGGTFRLTTVAGLNDAGQAIGTSSRFNGSAALVGQDAWLQQGSTTQIIGLSGNTYESPYGGPGGGVYRASEALSLNGSGQVAGTTRRLTASGNYLGVDAWLFNGSTSQSISLTGSAYEYTNPGPEGGIVRSSTVRQLNDAGQVIGYATRFTPSSSSVGQDAWYFNGSTTQAIGLTGAVYQAAPADGIYHFDTGIRLNDAGWASGATVRFNPSGIALGQDAWVFKGTAPEQIGLIGSGYEYTLSIPGGGSKRSSVVSFMNSGNAVAGTSSRYNSNGDTRGNDVWLYDGVSTRLIGLTGSGYDVVISGDTYRNGDIEGLNDAGGAIGWTERYDASGMFLGRAGWFFDPVSSTSTPLEFSFRASDGYSTTSPMELTEDGVVLGQYELFTGSTSENRAFYWSSDEGFHDLGALVEGGLSDAGWKNLSAAFESAGSRPSGSPLYIVGSGLLLDQEGGRSLFVMVPEPGSLGLLVVGLAGVMCGRARKRGEGS